MASDKSVMKKIGLGCLAILCVLLVVGVIGGLKLHSAIKAAGGWESFIRQKSSEYMQAAVNEAVEVLPLNTLEKQSITEPVRKLSARMSKGEVNPAQSRLVVLGTYRSLLPEAFMALIFQRKYLKNTDTADKLTVNRFVNGLLIGKITGEDAKRFTTLLLKEPHALDKLRQPPEQMEQDPAHEIKLKEEVSAEDVVKCVELMKEAADKAGMPFIRADMNFTPAIENVISQALSSHPEIKASPTPTTLKK